MKSRGFIIAGITLMIGVLGYYFVSQYLKIKELSYKLKSYRLRRFTLRDIIIEFLFEIENKSSLDIIITGYDIDVLANNVSIGKIRSGLSQKVDAKSMTTIAIPVQFDPTNVIKTAFKLENLNAIFNKKDDLIFSFDGTISLSANGLAINSLPIDTKVSLAELLKS